MNFGKGKSAKTAEFERQLKLAQINAADKDINNAVYWIQKSLGFRNEEEPPEQDWLHFIQPVWRFEPIVNHGFKSSNDVIGYLSVDKKALDDYCAAVKAGNFEKTIAVDTLSGHRTVITDIERSEVPELNANVNSAGSIDAHLREEIRKNDLKKMREMTIIDETTEFTQEMWDKLWARTRKNILGGTSLRNLANYYHGTATEFTINEQEKGRIKMNTAKIERAKKAGVVFPTVPTQTVPQKDTASALHYATILSNEEKDYWHGGNGRRIYIPDMVDNHLINTMKFLLRHAEKMREVQMLNISRVQDSTANAMIRAKLNEYMVNLAQEKTAPGMLSLMVMPFWSLAEEIIRRFDAETLRVLYDTTLPEMF